MPNSNPICNTEGPNSLKAIGKRIYYSRKEKSIKQSQLAKQLHVSLHDVSGWERGEKSINDTMLSKLADLLGKTKEYLLTGSMSLESLTDITPSHETVSESLIYSSKTYIQDFKSFQNAILTRTKDSPPDIQLMVKKAFETQEPFREVLRLLIGSYCSRTCLDMEDLTFSHILSIIPFLNDDSELSIFINMQNHDPDVYMMYALAPFVSQSIMDQWAGTCDFRQDPKAAVRLMPYFSEKYKYVFIERIILEMPSPSISIEFNDYLTEEIVHLLTTNLPVVNVAASLSKKLNTEQINDLVERCEPHNLPILAQYVFPNSPSETILRLIARCPEDHKKELIDIFKGKS